MGENLVTDKCMRASIEGIQGIFITMRKATKYWRSRMWLHGTGINESWNMTFKVPASLHAMNWCHHEIMKSFFFSSSLVACMMYVAEEYFFLYIDYLVIKVNLLIIVMSMEVASTIKEEECPVVILYQTQDLSLVIIGIFHRKLWKVSPLCKSQIDIHYEKCQCSLQF